MTNLRRIVVGISGASGTIFGIRALQMIRDMPNVESHLVMTGPAKTTLAIETDWSVADVEALADHVHGARDIAATISSGSFETNGMIVAPCSIKTLSAVANCFSADLLSRVADVTLKERRPLVLMVRETPLHLGHLRLMASAAEMGATIAPPVPAMYTRPNSIDDLVTYTTGRALEPLGLTVDGLARWSGPPQPGD